MQKAMIKSILTVAVAGTFATIANAAPTAYAPLDPNIDVLAGKLIEMNVDNNIKTLDAGVRANKAAIDNLASGKVDQNTYLNRVSTVNGEIEKLKLADTALQGKIDTNTTKIDANTTKINANKEQIDLLTRVDNAQNAQIAGLQHKNNTQDNQIKGNADAIKANTALINKNTEDLQGKIDTNTTKIDANTTKINANKEQIDLLTRVDNAQNAQIAGLQHKNNTQDNQIKGNADAIKANTALINKNTEDLQGKIDTNKANIAANHTIIEQYKASSDAQFKAVNSRIDSLDDKMKKGFASQAALNGLFQPYNVGKFNMSVAIGGYDSEQAMAFGSGYRFNENFAIKAGIASDLSGFDHVTYNIGANFEF